MIPKVCSEYSEHYFRDYQSVIPKSTYSIAWSYYNLLHSHWLAIWCIFRRSPLSEENYPNRNPAWKQALLIIDFQGNTRKGSSTSLSGAKSAINKKYFFIWKVFCVRLQRSWTSSLGVNYKIYAALERCNYCKCKTIDDCIIQPHPVRFCLTDTNDRIFFVLMQ